ncbi:MAG TPA: hypothetical protein VIV60_25255 [Polyangiaceae bacterium]
MWATQRLREYIVKGSCSRARSSSSREGSQGSFAFFARALALATARAILLRPNSFS